MILIFRSCMTNLKYIYIVEFMTFVRSSCARQQVLLDENFKSEGNVFSIPLKQTNKMIVIIRSVLAEYFGEDNFVKSSQTSRKQFSGRNSIQMLTDKIIELVEEGMKRCLQLAKIREIFKLLKGLQQKIKFYEGYIKSIEQIIGLNNQGRDNEEDEDEIELKSIFHKIDEKVKERAELYNGVSLAYDRQAQDSNSMFRLQSKVNHPFHDMNQKKTEQENDLLYTVHVSKSKTLRQELSNYKAKQLNTHYMRTELYSDIYESDEQNVLVRVENERTSDKSHPILYYPDIKRSCKTHCTNLKGKDENSKKSMNDSQFVSDLSKHIKPMPSALVNDSISDIMQKQEKEDRKKQTIIRRSIRGGNQTIHREGVCQDKLKKMKLNHKLRSIFPPSKRKNLQTQPDRIERGRMKLSERKIGNGVMDKIANYFNK